MREAGYGFSTWWLASGPAQGSSSGLGLSPEPAFKQPLTRFWLAGLCVGEDVAHQAHPPHNIARLTDASSPSADAQENDTCLAAPVYVSSNLL
jgi:hypothetical protein